jgi:hypothetical protein
MKVVFRQTGGFAGLVRGAELDTETLPPEEAANLRSLVQQSDLRNLRAGDESDEWRDLREYEISVETGQGVHDVAFDDRNIPAGAAPLLDFLKGYSEPRPLM